MISLKKKGFTLVEIIVVLVILAVLAAVTIPSMIGFVQDAEEKTTTAEARLVVLATKVARLEIDSSLSQATWRINYGAADSDSKRYTTIINDNIGNDIDYSRISTLVQARQNGGKEYVALFLRFPKTEDKFIYYAEVEGKSTMTSSQEEWYKFAVGEGIFPI